jgi:geranylgeranyl diphosphate synthase type II
LPLLREHTLHRIYRRYRDRVEQKLSLVTQDGTPSSVYRPIRYVLASGGKRLRAVLTLLSCEAVGGRGAEALPAAVAVELLHNFTLMHDDVMDNAALRRGRPTVHAKWNANAAILAGDEMIALAYRSLLGTRSRNLARVVDSFTTSFVEVCEGQGLDADFQSRRNVSLRKYRMMIEKKTASLITHACEIGGLIGNGKRPLVAALKRYGRHLGLAFQIQDDLLDITGDERAFGKAIGGDIREGKKTYVLLQALRLAPARDRAYLRSVSSGSRRITRREIGATLAIYRSSGAVKAAHEEIRRQTRLAARALAVFPESRAASALATLAHRLAHRQS